MKMFISAILFAVCSLGLAAKCSAADGNDLLIWNNGDGSDFARGGAGNDVLLGGRGNDVVLGQIAELELDLKAAVKEQAILIGLLLPAVQKVREAAARARLKELDLLIADLEDEIAGLKRQLQRK